MKQILIATHGKMASGIRYTAELIVGELAKITTIDAYVTPEDNVEKQFEEYFSAHREDRIFVFTDLMGGSVNQKLLRYAQQENVTLITGTNLPVLMQIMLADEDVEVEEIRQYIEDARQELQLVEIGKKEEEKPEIQYHEFDYSEDGESGELAEEFLPDEPEEAETYAAETETAAYENAEQLNTNYDAGHQNRYAQENEEDLFTSTEEDLEKGELNPYTGHEYESNSVRMHPNRIGYVQVYDRGSHQWTDMTEWAFLGYQERKKALLGKDYEPPIYLD